MTEFVTIARVRREDTARVLLAALRAHGFSPREQGDGGFPGMGGGFLAGGFPIEVPEAQARDAAPLAADLLKDMVDD